MHLRIGELLLAGVYLAAAVIVLIGIVRSHATKSRSTPLQQIQPPQHSVERKRDAKKKKRAA